MNGRRETDDVEGGLKTDSGHDGCTQSKTKTMASTRH